MAELLGEGERWRVDEGDCLDVLRTLPDDSASSCVTDPPSGTGFMKLAWDMKGRAAFIADLEARAREMYRVLRPGAYALVWALPRTSHWTGMAIETAGFHVQDRVTHLFAQGWPKSKNHLSPAAEDWWLCRKPFQGSVEACVETYGTGTLFVDGCRIYTDWNEPDRPESWKKSGHTANPDEAKIGGAPAGNGITLDPRGRWPKNAILSHLDDCRPLGPMKVPGDARGVAEPSGHRPAGFGDVGRSSGSSEPSARVYGDEDGMETVLRWDCAPGCPVAQLDEQAGERRSGSVTPGCGQSNPGTNKVYRGGFEKNRALATVSSSRGVASRFFYTPKATTKEREAGLSFLPGAARRKNIHPTVKPIALMRWLVRLITPPGGVVLDPFCGSGTTGIAALAEGARFLGIEVDPAYVAIARARIAEDTPLFNRGSLRA